MRLFLLRHAKSEWPEKAIGDHERTLNARGRGAVARIGAYMAQKNYVPDLVLCSTARRTRETLALLLASFHPRPEIRYARALYLAPWQTLLEAARETPPGRQSLLLVGHNPGIEQFAVALAPTPQNSGERVRAGRLSQKYPTCGLAVFEFSSPDWPRIGPGEGRLLDFVRPKDFSGEDDE